MFQRQTVRTVAKGIRRSPSYAAQSLRESAQSDTRSVSSRAADTKTLRSRFERVNARLPRFLQRFTSPLVSAPVTHISAFLILHELTAVIPLFGLAGLFHYTHWLPPFISEWKWIAEGVEKFGKYARRKGWISANEKSEIDRVEEDGVWTTRKDQVWNWSEGGTRVVVEFATAYAITKALLPLRLILSVWGTPWFAANALGPFTRLFSRRRPSAATTLSSTAPSVAAKASPAAGTNAVVGGPVTRKP